MLFALVSAFNLLTQGN